MRLLRAPLFFVTFVSVVVTVTDSASISSSYARVLRSLGRAKRISQPNEKVHERNSHMLKKDKGHVQRRYMLKKVVDGRKDIILYLDPCDPNPCGEGWTCSAHFSDNFDYEVWCSFTSVTTLEVVPDMSSNCDNHLCANGATCEPDPDNYYNCICAAGYKGPFCGTEIVDNCHNHLCLNGAQCTPDPDVYYTCSCVSGFTGIFCESPISAPAENCDFHICLNGASCEPDPYLYYNCVCAPGYSGILCESTVETVTSPPDPVTPMPDPCDPDPCKNGGVCSGTTGSAECLCTGGYTGQHCDEAPAGPDLSATTVWPLIDDSVDCPPMNNLDAGTEGITSGFFQNTPGCGASSFSGKQKSGEKGTTLVEILRSMSRIVGGEFGEPGQWPWHAIIGIKSVGPNCGASLIHPQWVLTAAHCVEFLEKAIANTFLEEAGFSPAPNMKPCHWNVRLGTPKHAITPETGNLDVTPIKLFYHKDYTFDNNVDNDIAMMKLEHPVTLTDNIQTICLPEKGTKFNPGEECYIMGYGENNVQSIEDLQANPEGENDLKFRYLKLTVKDCGVGTAAEQFICNVSGQYGQSPCRGDSGGSFVCKRGDTWYQAGLASTVADCGHFPDTLNYYTSVDYHLEWINSVMSRH